MKKNPIVCILPSCSHLFDQAGNAVVLDKITVGYVTNVDVNGIMTIKCGDHFYKLNNHFYNSCCCSGKTPTKCCIAWQRTQPCYLIKSGSYVSHNHVGGSKDKWEWKETTRPLRAYLVNKSPEYTTLMFRGLIYTIDNEYFDDFCTPIHFQDDIKQGKEVSSQNKIIF